MSTLRIAILGAGAVGSAAARTLAAAGHTVTVFERFRVDHDRGSSYGASRIIRRTYTDRLYTALMREAFPLWTALEHDAGESLWVRCGGLFFGRDGGPEMRATCESLASEGVPFETLDRAEGQRRFPMFRLHEHEIAVWEQDAGFLRASAVVRASVRLAVRAGAALREETPVDRVVSASDGVRIHLASGGIETFDRVIVAAGAWAPGLLGARCTVPMQVSRQVYCHLAPHGEVAAFDPTRMPVWIDMDDLFYGFPDDGVAPGIKVALHVMGDVVDPNAVERTVHDRDRAPLVDYASSRLPGLSDRVTFEKVCLYTNTPDTDFVVDRDRDDARIAFVAGLSGHGFKFAVLLGRIAASLVLDEAVPPGLARFSARRSGGPGHHPERK